MGTDPSPASTGTAAARSGPEDLGSHTICAVVTAEFLAHQRSIGNDLPARAALRLPRPGAGRPVVRDRRQLAAGAPGRRAAHVVLASTHERALEIVPLEMLLEHAVDVPAHPGALEE